MERILVLLEGDLLQDLLLDKDFVQIGRDSDNDIHLRDAVVSRNHARLVRESGRYVVQDLESTNGIRVNGHRVKRQVLSDGDVLQIGNFRLQYLQSGAGVGVFQDTAPDVPKHEDSGGDLTFAADRELPVGSGSAAGAAQPEVDDTAGEPPEFEAGGGEVAVQGDSPDGGPEALDLELEADEEDSPESFDLEPEPEPVADAPGGTAQSLAMELESVAEALEQTDAGGADDAAKATNIATIRHLAGKKKGQTESVSKAMLRVGEPGRDLAVVTRRPDGYYLLYVGGDAFPKVNGDRVHRKRVQLKHGDLIEVGGTRVEFLLDAAD